MRTSVRWRLATMAVSVMMAAGCGGGAPAEPATISPEVLEALQVPDSPYWLIYSPPVDLAKRPAT
jgi:hypothetical protein